MAHFTKRAITASACGALKAILMAPSLSSLIPATQIAAPSAPHAPPLSPIPPARPAAMTACSSEAPIRRAMRAAQLAGAGGTATGSRQRAASISRSTTGAYRAARRKQPMVPPLIRKMEPPTEGSCLRRCPDFNGSALLPSLDHHGCRGEINGSTVVLPLHKDPGLFQIP